MPNYKVQDFTLLHDGGRYEAGEVVEMSEEAAAHLVETGRLKKTTGKVTGPEPDKETKAEKAAREKAEAAAAK